MLRTENTIASLRQRAAAIADRYIPATDREVTPADNAPPEEIERETDQASVTAYTETALADVQAITAATEQAALLKAFIADNPVIQTAKEAQAAAAWIESTRRTLGAMEDERKPKVDPLNAALASINGAYRIAREPLESMLSILRTRWNKWDTAERVKREAAAEAARCEAAEAARRAQELVALADDAIAGAEVGECTDAGSAIVEAKAAIRDAGRLDREAGRAERATNVRVASTFGGKALASRKRRVIVIDDPCAAIKAIGLTEKIITALRQSAEAFEEVHGELPAGTRATFERSI